jgi:hypothetical protein
MQQIGRHKFQIGMTELSRFTQSYERAQQNGRTECLNKQHILLNMDTIFVYLVISFFILCVISLIHYLYLIQKNSFF